MALSPGTKLGPYEITSRIGSGRMGDVYRGKDTASNRDIALKILPQAFTADRNRLTQFQADVETIGKLSHPNIGQVYGLQEAALHDDLHEGRRTMAHRHAAQHAGG